MWSGFPVQKAVQKFLRRAAWDEFSGAPFGVIPALPKNIGRAGVFYASRHMRAGRMESAMVCTL
ncbi:MAG: hypothetical protein JETCAE02_06150 [Anaerolineaceae bacterium]|nr:hypothetical protein DIM_22800 [Candidatus Denitrolinea symbiosum]GIK09132.1 MAG: hypothetical protein BroJett001_11980 [Chloroflexota bacterium]GJQ38203.1 MAG: hypothetical protein JETCAE02_06150 [Anaerolineaceae bacterium]